MDLESSKSLKVSLALAPGESLWKRAPTHGDDGRLLADFMMLIPGLNKRSSVQIQIRVEHIAMVLGGFDQVVVFADLNMKLNLLWVSHRPVAGSCTDIATSVQMYVPEAKLIAQRFD